MKNYLLVTKPGIVFANLLSATVGFLLASKGDVDFTALTGVLAGISLVVASACVFNNIIDRDTDRKMERTKNRVLAQKALSPKTAFFYALILCVTGTAVLSAATNTLSVVVVLSGFAIYVGVYSLYLKRRSVFAALIGSLAGAAPPLAGYCAVGNRLDMGALILLSIFSLWQMPHCYAIAVFRLKDYAKAGIPVLPVRRGVRVAKKHIIGYILVFTGASLLPTLGGYTGYGYFAVALAVGLIWLYLASAGFRTSNDRLWAKRMFTFSIVVIFSLSVMMAMDFTKTECTSNQVMSDLEIDTDYLP